jgi:hypothetical protein
MRATENQLALIGRLTGRSKSGVYALLANEHGFFNSTAARERATIDQASKTIDRLIKKEQGIDIMEPSGRFGGRASNKAGGRDSVLAMDETFEITYRDKDGKRQRFSVEAGSDHEARRKNAKDAQGSSELENEYNEGTDEYRDEAAEAVAESRGRQDDREQVATGPTNEFREPVGIADARIGRFGGRGSDKAGARDVELTVGQREWAKKNLGPNASEEDVQKAVAEAQKNRLDYKSAGATKARDLAMDPLTSKGEEIKSSMQKEYGPKKGESVFYASANKGTIKGVHG